MKILAIDLGSLLGYASGINEKITKHGSRHFAEHKWFSNESFASFYNWLNPLVGKVDTVVCEKPNSHMPGFHAYRVLFGMYGIVQGVVGGWQKSLIPVSASAIKLHWAGHGQASKEHMCQACASKGFNVENHNECDAIAIYNYYWEVLRGRPAEDQENSAE